MAKTVLDPHGASTLGKSSSAFGTDQQIVRMAQFVDVQRLDLVLDQECDPFRPVDEAALGQPVRPMGEGDLEKIEGDAPLGIIKIRRQRFEPRPRRALDDHVVDQRGQIASKRVSLRRRGRDQRRLGRIEDELPVGLRLPNCAF